jgi:DNA-directed RNA polymerase subunit RPC12/RpoP
MQNANSAPNEPRICTQCNHRWTRSWPNRIPRECPACHSRRWNKPKPEPLDPEIYRELEIALYKAFRLRPPRKRRATGSPVKMNADSSHVTNAWTQGSGDLIIQR